METRPKADSLCCARDGGRRVKRSAMSFNAGSATSNEGYCATAGDYHVELRPYQDQWEYQIVSLKEHKVLQEGITPRFEQCRQEAILTAKRLASSLKWDTVQWLPLHAGR